MPYDALWENFAPEGRNFSIITEYCVSRKGLRCVRRALCFLKCLTLNAHQQFCYTVHIYVYIQYNIKHTPVFNLVNKNELLEHSLCKETFATYKHYNKQIMFYKPSVVSKRLSFAVRIRHVPRAT